jgi:hypothetical protein
LISFTWLQWLMSSSARWRVSVYGDTSTAVQVRPTNQLKLNAMLRATTS